ncbi:MAG TPA: serine hydrolase [Anaerolineae bacterium]|nr:serine hydrolase [Anaerolineae bacterium]
MKVSHRAPGRVAVQDTGPVGLRLPMTRLLAFSILALLVLCVVSPHAAPVHATMAEAPYSPRRSAEEGEVVALAGGEQRDPAPRRQDYRDWPVIAAIEDVGGNAEESVPFALEGCTRLRVYGSGAGSNWGMEDLAYVEDVDTGQVIWQMYEFEASQLSAGIREVDRPLTLPAGSYQLYFSTQARTHQPPGQPRVGITLYEDMAPGASSSSCWARAARPEDLGWSSRRLRRIVPELGRMDCAALMVVTDGQVVLEWGNTANNFSAHSMRKSLLSALYGVYVNEGAIDTFKTLAELGIDDKTPLTETEKQATVTDLLRARSGVYIPAAGETASMRAARPERGSHAPGTFWYYNNWDFNALGTIFDQETGEKSIYEAFQARIADPIGMQDMQTERLQYSYEPYSMHPYYGYRISARDLARFGQLFLQEGAWEGEQIVPAAWVEESTTPYSRTGGSGTYSGYGYMWWIAAEDAASIAQGSYAASGYGGHTLEVLPHLNSVIVYRTNTDDPAARLTAGSRVDQLVVRILRASDRVPNPYRNAERALAAWGIVVAASLAYLGLEVRRTGSTRDAPAWVLVTILFGPLALLAYLTTCAEWRRPPNAGWKPKLGWRALRATLYSAAGYAIAWALVETCFLYLWPSRPALVTLLIVYGVPFTIGLLAFRAPFLSAHLGTGYGTALRRGVLVEAISTNLSVAGAFPMAILALDRWWHGQLSVESPLFWISLLILAMASLVPVYPYHLWMMQRGFAVWPGGPQREAAGQENSSTLPSWRSARAPWWISFGLLTSTIGLIAVFLA